MKEIIAIKPLSSPLMDFSHNELMMDHRLCKTEVKTGQFQVQPLVESKMWRITCPQESSSQAQSRSGIKFFVRQKQVLQVITTTSTEATGTNNEDSRAFV